MTACFVSVLPDDSLLLTGRIRDDECSNGHFRVRLRPGSTLYGIGFEEWKTLSGIDVSDNGAVTKRPRGEPAQPDPNVTPPPFLRDAS